MDVAGRNVLLASDVAAGDPAATARSVRLSDFGLTAPFGDTAPVVSIPWSPPESILAPHDQRRASGAHDVWSLGCVCVECLTGHVPWHHLYDGSGFASLKSWMEEIIRSVGGGGAPPRPDVCNDSDVAGRAGILPSNTVFVEIISRAGSRLQPCVSGQRLAPPGLRSIVLIAQLCSWGGDPITEPPPLA
eukprot:gene57568-biopygen16882